MSQAYNNSLRAQSEHHSHNPEDCFWLKITIEKLIQGGYLAEFITNNRPTRPDIRAPKQQSLGNINVVSGATSGGGDSQSGRKRHIGESRVDVAYV